MIGKNIKKIRNKKGLTLTELAEKADISKSYLSNIERSLNDNPSIQVLEKIASVLNVDFRALMEMDSSGDKEYLESEWLEFIRDLQEIGIDKEKLGDVKVVIEFLKWQREQGNI